MNSQPGALFYRTDQERVYIWSGSDWIAVNNTSLYYDTLFLVKNNGYTPANLDLGTLTVHANVYMDFEKECSFWGSSVAKTLLGKINASETEKAELRKKLEAYEKTKAEKSK